MTFPLAYCPHGDEVLERLRALFERRDPGLVLATMGVQSTTVQELTRGQPAGYCSYPDPKERARFWSALLRERAAIHDDTIPSAYLSEMDQGLYGGLLGGEVLFLYDPGTSWVSSMVRPILQDWSELDSLSFSTDSEWFRRYERQMDVFVEATRGKFGISHFILINGLNLVFELVGATEAYRALIDRPETVRRALELAHRLNLTVQSAFFKHVPLLEGGTCSAMVQWIRGRVITESVDPFHMTSVRYFEEWGRPVLERIFAEFDGGVVHIHGNGRHILKAVATVKGLKAIALGDDRGYPLAIDVLPDLRREAADLPLTVSVPFDVFQRLLRERRLLGGVLYNVHSVPDVAAANRCMELVRAYRA